MLQIPENCKVITDNKITGINPNTGELLEEKLNRCVPKLERNVATFYKIGGNTKLVFQPTRVAEGVDTHKVHEYNLETGWTETDEKKQKRKKESQRTSISRTKRIVHELAACNKWKYFVTITLSPEKWDRYNDHERLKESFAEMAKKWRRKNTAGVAKLEDFKYLIIPELHQDSAIHLHGFVSDVPIEYKIPFLSEFVNGNKPLPSEICDMVRNGEAVYHCSHWDELFGFNTLSEIKDPDRAASYITKYVTKSFDTSLFKVKYWCSRGLKRAKQIGKFTIDSEQTDRFLSEIRDMSAVTKRGNKMYFETDTSILADDNSNFLNNEKLLNITAYINSIDHSEKEVLNKAFFYSEN